MGKPQEKIHDFEVLDFEIQVWIQAGQLKPPRLRERAWTAENGSRFEPGFMSQQRWT